MPEVISYTPPWLSRPSPGATLFSIPSAKGLGLSINGQKKSDYSGPSRTLARRGNEVFTVVDNQIRWSSLSKLKDEWRQQSRSKKDSANSGGQNGDASGSQGNNPNQAHYRVGGRYYSQFTT